MGRFLNHSIFVRVYVTVCALFVASIVHAQPREPDPTKLDELFHTPLQYTAIHTAGPIRVDGRDDEPAWGAAPWTAVFGDIVTGKPVNSAWETRAKIIWDDAYVYLYVELKEPGIWASITQHDLSVFQDNAFEMFIDQDGDTRNYVEFQINAYATVWDLFMPKPYRNGGQSLTSWDIKGLKKAVRIDGTLNDASDTDRAWYIELGIPVSALGGRRGARLRSGTIWRMNFSRVEWDTEMKDGKYSRKVDASGRRLPEHYLVWSPQGLVNLHFPERWGYVRFADQPDQANFISEDETTLTPLLWKYYYWQQDYKALHGRYAPSLKTLEKAYHGKSPAKSVRLSMEATPHLFLLKCYFPSLQHFVTLDQEGLIRRNGEGM